MSASRRSELKKAVKIDERDNVATVTSDIYKDETLEVLSPEGIIIMMPQAKNRINFGHKIALLNLQRGDKVLKYGEIIGVASQTIEIGEWVHTQNLESAVLPTAEFKEENEA